MVTLKTVDPTVLGVERPYFYKTQVEKVKAIMSFMTCLLYTSTRKGNARDEIGKLDRELVREFTMTLKKSE